MKKKSAKESPEKKPRKKSEAAEDKAAKKGRRKTTKSGTAKKAAPKAAARKTAGKSGVKKAAAEAAAAKSSPQKGRARTAAEKKGAKKRAGKSGVKSSPKKSAAGKSSSVAKSPTGNQKFASGLRRRAEAELDKQLGRLELLSGQDKDEIIHELGTHQIELEIQNEELRRAQAELEDSRARLADLYNDAPVGYFTFDFRGRITSVNQTGAAMLDTTREKLVNNIFPVFIHHQDSDKFHLHLRAVLQEKSAHSSELRLRSGTDDGNVHIKLESIPVTDLKGKVLEVRSTASDITARKIAQERLEQQNSLLRVIMDHTDVLMAYLDPEFNFIWVNQVYAENFKMLSWEMAGRNHFDLFPDAGNMEIFQSVRDSGEPVFYKDKPFRYKDQPEMGLTYWDWSLVPVKNELGLVSGLVLSLKETTPFRKVQMALEESEQLFRSMADTSNDIIFRIDYTGTLLYTSPAVKSLGYSQEEVTGRPFREFVASEDLARAETTFINILRGNRVKLEAFKLINTEGFSLDFEINANPIIQNDVVVGVQGIARDISERLLAEEKIRQLARFPAENPFPVIRLNKEGVILYANRASSPLLESWGVDVDELLPEEIRKLAIDVFSSGTAREIEQICGDRTLALNLVPIYEGNFVNIYAIDITDRKLAEDIILKSETQLKTTLHNLNEGVIVSDLKGDLIYWNPASLKEFGFSSEEEYLRNFRDFKTSLELSTSEDGVLSVERWPLNRILQGETLRNWEVDVRRLDSDSKRTYNFGGTLVRDKDGNPLMAILTLLDITDRKVLMEKILQAKQEWEQTFDAVPDLIAILDTDHKILRANKAMAEKVSIHPKELPGKKCFSVLHGISEPLENCPFTLTKDDNREHSFEFEDSHLGGYYHVTTTPIFNGQGKLAKIIHVFRDITKLKETEEALRQAHKKLEERYAIKIESLKESEIKYSSLVQALLTGVFICMAGKIVFVNNQFSKMFGYEHLELINRKIMELIHPGDREFFRKMFDTSAQTRIHEESYELRGIRKNDDVFHLLGRSTIIKLKNQEAVLGNFFDITVRKTSEEKLRKSKDELREFNVKLKHLSSQLLTAQETERSRISRELHDEVGGSLALIKLRISTIENKLQPDQETIREECRLNMQYIDHLSENVQRISRDLSPSILEDLGLTTAINWLGNNFIKFYGINTTLNVENVDHLFSTSDQIMIYRTLQEGLTNIGKHAQAQNVVVKVWAEGGQIFILIEDDGRGFETTGLAGKNNLEKGLGMATMHERARMLGGILNIWSEQGKGTRINLSIPIRDGAGAR